MPGFDFAGLSGKPGLLRSRQVCLVDHTYRFEPIGVKARSRHDYPAHLTHRLQVRCRITTVRFAWIEVLFTDDNQHRAPHLLPGTRLEVRIIDDDHGFADRPQTRFLGSWSKSEQK